MGNRIHPTAIIEKDVELGNNNEIGAYSIIKGPTKIGDDNIISPHVVIGEFGQDTRNPRYEFENKEIKIGSRNIIREFTTIQKPCYEDLTSIGDDVYLMMSVHVPHDAQIANKVVITPMCVLAGITRILEGANLGMGVSINQYNVIGHYSIVATGAAAMKNVKPFSRYIPGKSISVNKYAIRKYGFAEFEEEISTYVLSGERPKSQTILGFIEEFDMYHIKSGRDLYA